jgi:hypothetical protein
MKLTIVLGALVAASLIGLGTAAADNGRPTVHAGLAERYAYGILQKRPSWRYRTEGYVDCRFGKINRYTWACRVGWYQGRTCHRGRVRVTGTYREHGYNNYNVHFRGSGAYRCVGG